MTTYSYTWRNKCLTMDAETIDDMIERLQAAANELQAMKANGVILDKDSDIAGDWATLTSTDPKVAEEFGFELNEPDEDEEDEDWDENECDAISSEDESGSRQEEETSQAKSV